MNTGSIISEMPSVESVVASAVSAADAVRSLPLTARAGGLLAMARALDAAANTVVPLAAAETGLGEQRLRGELRRTTAQLRLFADAAAAGAFLDVHIDEADPNFVLGTRPDVRRFNIAIGPVVNFAASNFPFAFSVAGGDTAAALAAGCSVVVKGHPGHPELSVATWRIASDALIAAGLPAGVLGLVLSQEEGVKVLQDPRIKAATFTGSLAGGRALAAIAAARPEPIPFFGELSSVNPVFVTESAALQRLPGILNGFFASVSGSAGQLCTKPGFLFLPRGSAIDDILLTASSDATEHRMLTRSIATGYGVRRELVLATQGVRTLVEGSLDFDRPDADGDAVVTPTIVLTDVETMRRERERLLDEAFGPLAVVVEYDDEAALSALAREFFPGNLTGSVHLADGEQSTSVACLITELSLSSGRVLVNGWPTGVAVTPAMHHGGPFPATTNGGTSVGTAAISRLLRAVAYQDVPDSLLPEPLRNSNPWGVPQSRALPGESTRWGERAADAEKNRPA